LTSSIIDLVRVCLSANPRELAGRSIRFVATSEIPSFIDLLIAATSTSAAHSAHTARRAALSQCYGHAAWQSGTGRNELRAARGIRAIAIPGHDKRLTTGPKVLLFDDPVAHVDDINTPSLLDHLREIARTNQRLILFATADSKIASLFIRKFRFLGDRFKQIELSRD
jgi:hypothetical protein